MTSRGLFEATVRALALWQMVHSVIATPSALIDSLERWKDQHGATTGWQTLALTLFNTSQFIGVLVAFLAALGLLWWAPWLARTSYGSAPSAEEAAGDDDAAEMRVRLLRSAIALLGVWSAYHAMRMAYWAALGLGSFDEAALRTLSSIHPKGDWPVHLMIGALFMLFAVALVRRSTPIARRIDAMR